MTTHDRDKIIAAAKEAGFTYYGEFPEAYKWRIDALYAIAFENGRQAGKEEAAELIEKINRARGDTK